MIPRNPKVDAYLRSAGKWRAAMERLRAIALDAGLTEELKWRQPCYTFQRKNVAILQGFQETCALMFFRGALLKDPEGLLERPGPNSHAARRMVFTGVDAVVEREGRLRGFLADAIENERSGRKVAPRKDGGKLPAELEEMFAKVSGLERAFRALTPGRQRAYVLHVSGAKQAATRRSRTEKCVPRILAGKGLDDA